MTTATKQGHTPGVFPVRACSIICTDHPEWGTWAVYEDKGGYYEIFGRGGHRVLDKDEAATSWRIEP